MIADYDRRAPDRAETETATFGLGCFWGPDARFGAIEGVVRTRVGYAGGTKPDPTYHDLGDHTETLQVDFDPDSLGFADVVDRVVRSHDPNRQTASRQYQNVVFADSPAQRGAIDAALDERGLDAAAIETRIERLDRFTPAESYHQKYRLRAEESLFGTFEEAGYDDERVRESPAAATLNGAAAGHDLPSDRDLTALVSDLGQ